jgi:hypothetical protein
MWPNTAQPCALVVVLMDAGPVIVTGMPVTPTSASLTTFTASVPSPTRGAIRLRSCTGFMRLPMAVVDTVEVSCR